MDELARMRNFEDRMSTATARLAWQRAVGISSSFPEIEILEHGYRCDCGFSLSGVSRKRAVEGATRHGSDAHNGEFTTVLDR